MASTASRSRSLFQSEGDDEGRVDVALDDGNPSTEPQWQTVDGTGGFFAPVLESNPVTDELAYRRADLSRFKGKKLLLRFRYILGPEDRAGSHPAGWYIDDVSVRSGAWSTIGSSTAETFNVTVAQRHLRLPRQGPVQGWRRDGAQQRRGGQGHRQALAQGPRRVTTP